MTELLETTRPDPTPARGRPAMPVICRDTGREFASIADAVAWLNGQGRPATAGSLENAMCQNVCYKGYRWKRPGRPAGSARRGPMKGCGGRPRKGESAPVVRVPRTPVNCPDTGESYRDAKVAAEVLRAQGYPAEPKAIVAAIASGEIYAGRTWDWRGRHLCFCGTEAEAGCKCPGCAERAAAFAAPGAVVVT